MHVVLVTHFERTATGGSPDRTWGLCHGLEATGHQVDVLQLPIHKAPWAPRHEPWWYLRPTSEWKTRARDALLDADLAIGSSLPAADALTSALLGMGKKPILVYDGHNDEARLAARYKARYPAWRIRGIEDRVVRGTDVVWMAGALDAHSLRARHPSANILDVPNGVGGLPDLSGVSLRPGAAFTYGSWTYEPNVLGLKALSKARFEQPGELDVFGDMPSELEAKLRRNSTLAQASLSWSFRGFEPDIRTVAGSGATAIIPVWTGGGTKLRTVQLAAMGVPMVVTNEALSGLPDWFTSAVPTAESPAEILRMAFGGAAQLGSLVELQRRVRAEFAWTRIVGDALKQTPGLS